MTLTGEQIYTTATLSVTNPAMTDLGFKLGPQGKRPRPPKRIKQKLWHRRSRRCYFHDHHTHLRRSGPVLIADRPAHGTVAFCLWIEQRAGHSPKQQSTLPVWIMEA